jgi:polar amino acid transport system substrate-binding protein
MRKIFRRLIKVGAVALAGVSLFGTAACSKSKEKVLHVSTKGRPSPYISVDEKGKLYGYDIEVVNLAAEKIGYKVEYTITDDALAGAQAGIYDFTVNNWSYNDSRAETYYYSYPYTKPSYSVVARNNSSIYTTFEEWGTNHLRFAASSQNNTTNAIERWNEANPTKKVTINYVEGDIPTLLLKLQSGDADFLIFDDAMVAQYETTYAETFATLQTAQISDQEVKTNISEHLTSHLLFGKNVKGADDLRKKLSEAIYELKTSGKLLELSQKYFLGVDLTPDEEDFVYLN